MAVLVSRIGRGQPRAPGSLLHFVPGDVVVSAVAANGIPAGNDTTGTGTVSNPYATFDKAYTSVTTGKTIWFNGTRATPSNYQAITTASIGKAVSFRAIQRYGATISGSGTTRALLLATSCNLTIRDLIIDPSLNSGGAAAIGIDIPSTTLISLTLNNVKFQNWTDRAISAAGGCRVNYTQTNCIFNGGNVNGAVYLNAFTAGAIVIVGGSSTISAQKLSGSTGGNFTVIGAVPNTATFSCTGFNTSTTLDNTLTLTGTHYGMHVFGIPNTLIDNGTHDMLGAPGSRQGQNARIEWNSTNVIDGSRITNCTGNNTTNGGIIFGIGADAQVTPQGSACYISGCTATAGSTFRTGVGHAFFLGCLTNSYLDGTNTATDVGIGFVDKGTNGTTIPGILTINGFSSSGIRAKGSVNAVYTNFSITQKTGYDSTTMIDLSADGAVNTTGVAFTGTFNNSGGTGTTFLVKTATDSATPSNNVYTLTSGTLNANPWQWGATNYATLGGWKNDVEATASGNGPYDAAVTSWQSAVITNGGTASTTMLTSVDKLVYALTAAGTWALTDDYWLLVAENRVQALTSLKQRRLATAVNSPTFTANRGYAFDGATNYINTGFVPSTNAVAMTGSNVRIGVYERINLAALNYAAGASNTSTKQIDIGPRTGSNGLILELNSGGSVGFTITDSRGFTVGNRNGSTYNAYKNGANLGAFTPGSSSTLLPTCAEFIGGYDNNGSGLAGARATTIGALVIGASYASDAQALAEYNAIQAYMTAWGANV